MVTERSCGTCENWLPLYSLFEGETGLHLCTVLKDVLTKKEYGSLCPQWKLKEKPKSFLRHIPVSDRFNMGSIGVLHEEERKKQRRVKEGRRLGKDFIHTLGISTQCIYDVYTLTLGDVWFRCRRNTSQRRSEEDRRTSS